MKSNIEPTSNGIVGRIFPGLQTVAMRQVVRGFPVVEGLVTVLNGREEGSREVRCEKDIEGSDRLNHKGRGCPTSKMRQVSGLHLKPLFKQRGTYFFFACCASGWTYSSRGRAA